MIRLLGTPSRESEASLGLPVEAELATVLGVSVAKGPKPDIIDRISDTMAGGTIVSTDELPIVMEALMEVAAV